MCAKGFVDLAAKFLFLLSEAAELRLSHFNVATNVLAIAVIAFSRTKIHHAETIVLSTVAAFLDHSISENVDEIGKVKATGSAIGRSTNSRHLGKP